MDVLVLPALLSKLVLALLENGHGLKGELVVRGELAVFRKRKRRRRRNRPERVRA